MSSFIEVQRLLREQLSPKRSTAPIIFDVETGGIYEGQGIYSYSIRNLFDPLPGSGSIDPAVKSVYFDYRDPTKRQNWSFFSQEAWTELNKIHPNLQFSTDSIQTALKRDIVSHLNNGGVMVGHNLRFDLAAVSQEMDPSDLDALKKYYGLGDTEYLSKISKSYQAENIIKNINVLDKQGNRFNSYGKAYGSFVDEIAARLRAGQGAIIDTQFMLQMAMGISGEEKLIDFGHGGIDIYNATKLSFLNKMLTGEFTKHDASDVTSNKRAFDFLAEFYYKYENKSLKGSQELDVIYNLQKLQKYNAANTYEKNLLEMVMSGFQKDAQTGEYVFTGEFIRGTKKGPGGRTVPKGQPDYVAGLKEALEQNGSFRQDSIGAQKYGFTLKKAESEGISLLETIKNEIEAAAKLGTGESEKVYTKYMQQLLTNYTDEAVHNKAAAAGELKNITYEPGARYELSHAFNTPGGKMLLGLGALAVLSTAYIAMSGGHESPPEVKQSRISSKDDDYNTIEGLHPGAGRNAMGKLMLQSNSDFGSGWIGGISKAFKNIGIKLKGLSTSSKSFNEISAHIDNVYKPIHEFIESGESLIKYNSSINKFTINSKISTIHNSIENLLNTTIKNTESNSRHFANYEEYLSDKNFNNIGLNDVSDIIGNLFASYNNKLNKKNQKHFIDLFNERYSGLFAADSSTNSVKLKKSQFANILKYNERELLQNINTANEYLPIINRYDEYEKTFNYYANTFNVNKSKYDSNINELHNELNKYIDNKQPLGIESFGQTDGIVLYHGTPSLNEIIDSQVLIPGKHNYFGVGVNTTSDFSMAMQFTIARGQQSTDSNGVLALVKKNKHQIYDKNFIPKDKNIIFQTLEDDTVFITNNQSIKINSIEAPRSYFVRREANEYISELSSYYNNIGDITINKTYQNSLNKSMFENSDFVNINKSIDLSNRTSSLLFDIDDTIIRFKTGRDRIATPVVKITDYDIIDNEVANAFIEKRNALSHGMSEQNISGLNLDTANASIGRGTEESKVFGSGWHGNGREDFSPYQGQNADLNPAYNQYKDEYKFNLFRASRIGLSESDMYKEMTEEKGQGSEFSAASASAGTALHGYLQAKAAAAGLAYGQEELVINREHGVTGHIDIITQMGIGDIKTVNTGVFNAIKKTGKPKPMHYDQVQFYLGTTGMEQGYIQYVNRDNIQQQKFYTFDFDPYHYEKMMDKLERTRSNVKSALLTGELALWKMPKAASVESLENYQRTEHESLEEIGNQVDFYRGKFRQEMKYLRSVSRGMPNDQQAKQRIKEANDERRKRKIENAMVTTQGIMLQAFNDRSRHHIM